MKYFKHDNHTIEKKNISFIFRDPSNFLLLKKQKQNKKKLNANQNISS